VVEWKYRTCLLLWWNRNVLYFHSTTVEDMIRISTPTQ
jgi:hypothetical protein